LVGSNKLVAGGVQEGCGDQLVVRTPLGRLHAIGSAAVQGRCVLAIRPENVSLIALRAAAGPGAGVPAGEGSGPELGPPENGNVVRGRIAFAAYLGNTLRYDVEASGGHVLKADVRDPWHHEPLQVGRDVAVSFPASATLAVSDDDARE